MNKNTKMTFYRSIKIQVYITGKLETLGSSFSNETALAGCLSPSFEKSKTITENI